MKFMRRAFFRYGLGLAGGIAIAGVCWISRQLGMEYAYLPLYPLLFFVAYELGPGPCAVSAVVSVAAVGGLLALSDRPDLALQTWIVLLGAVPIVGLSWKIWRDRRAGRKQREREALLRAVVESTPDSVFVKDRAGRIVLANGATAAVIGKPADAIIGKRADEYLSAPSAGRSIMENDERVMRSGRTLVFEEHVPMRGGMRIFLSTKTPYRNAEGDVVGVIGIARDITERKRAEDALRTHEETLSWFVKHTPVAVAMFDAQMRYMVYSDRWLSDYGLGQQNLVGRNHYEVFPEIREEWKQVHQRCLRGATEKRDEDSFVRADGTLQWQRWEIFPWRKVDGTIGGIIVFTEDITARKRTQVRLQELLELSQRRASELDAIIEAIPHAVYFGDANGITRCNSVALQMLGAATREAFQEKSPEFGGACRARDRGSGALVAREALPFHLALRGENAVCDIWLGENEGEKKLVRSHAAPVRVAGRIVGAVAVDIDITSHYRIEEALQEMNRRKDEFLAMLAHELRNPLAPIRNAVHILRMSGAEGETLRRQRDTIDRQVTHMSRLLDDLLDVSRITRGKISLRKQPVSIAEIFERVQETVTPLISARKQVLHISLPRMAEALAVEGDPDRLAQIFSNLLTNAAKYTDLGGQIWFEGRREGGEAVVTVRDNGIGIAPEILSRIFELFTQANRSLARSQGGLGIGLTLVRSLVRMHGGTVEAHSRGLGQGSEFVVRLPALAGSSQPAAAGVEKSRESPLAEQRVLVVDDVPDTVQGLAEVLRYWGQTVATAGDGWSALETAATFKPDVVLLDIGLPGLDGFEVARQIRQTQARAITIISMSGYGQDDFKQRARHAGIDQYLVKPVSLDQLKTVLAQAAHPG